MNSKIKVALVVPNFTWCDWDENTRWRYIPYNLCMLAAMIEDFCEIKIIDANSHNLNTQAFQDILSEFNPKIVGITVLMDQYGPAGHYAAKLAKQCLASAIVVMGGVYVTMNTLKAMEDTNIDYAVIGEGEYTFRNLLLYLAKETNTLSEQIDTLTQQIDTLPEKGVAYRVDDKKVDDKSIDDKSINNKSIDGKISNSKIIITERSEFINDLNQLPLPAYHLIDFQEYVANPPKRRSVDAPSHYPYARIVTSRGCPYGCVFCQVESISGKKFRPRSPQNIISEIKWLKEKYNIKSLIFDDDNLYTDRKRAKAIFKGMIDNELSMPWISISAAAFKIDDELLELMRKSGCEYINIAVESGNRRVLKEIIGKPIELEQALHVTQKAQEKGIYVAANFIIGFPTETWDEIRETISFAEKLDADYVKIFVAIPLPHTKLWELCEKTGSFKKEYLSNQVRWSTGQTSSDQFTDSDLTILRAYEWDRINFSSKEKRARTAERMGISEEELLDIRRRTLYLAKTNLH